MGALGPMCTGPSGAQRELERKLTEALTVAAAEAATRFCADMRRLWIAYFLHLRGAARGALQQLHGAFVRFESHPDEETLANLLRLHCTLLPQLAQLLGTGDVGTERGDEATRWCDPRGSGGSRGDAADCELPPGTPLEKESELLQHLSSCIAEATVPLLAFTLCELSKNGADGGHTGVMEEEEEEDGSSNGPTEQREGAAMSGWRKDAATAAVDDTAAGHVGSNGSSVGKFCPLEGEDTIRVEIALDASDSDEMDTCSEGSHPVDRSRSLRRLGRSADVGGQGMRPASAPPPDESKAKEHSARQGRPVTVSAVRLSTAQTPHCREGDADRCGQWDGGLNHHRQAGNNRQTRGGGHFRLGSPMWRDDRTCPAGLMDEWAERDVLADRAMDPEQRLRILLRQEQLLAQTFPVDDWRMRRREDGGEARCYALRKRLARLRSAILRANREVEQLQRIKMERELIRQRRVEKERQRFPSRPSRARVVTSL